MALPYAIYPKMPKRLPLSLGFSRYGLDFNGINNNVLILYAPILNPSTAITVEAYIKPSTGLGFRDVIGKLGAYILRRAGQTNWRFSLYIDGAYRTVLGISGVVNAPTHVAGTYDSVTREMRIYVNGVFENTLTLVLYMSPYYFRVNDGDPCPPRVYRLYQTGTNNLLAGLSVNPDVTSHPFPLFGYAEKTISFQADEAGTLAIQVLKQTDNWRTYDSVAVAVNTLLEYPISANEMLGRIIFTPTAPPANIVDAEVILR